MKCPKCSSDNIKSEGNRSLYSKSVNFDFFVCEDCGFQFAENPSSHESEKKAALPTREELLEKIRRKHQEEDLQQEKIDAYAKGIDLPAPLLFEALQSSFQNSTGNISAQEDLLKQFPIYGNRLLSLVNSPVFFDDKIARDFSDLLRNFPPEDILYLVLALEMVDLLVPPPDFPISRNDFWLHGMAVGLSAQSLARSLGEDRTETFFVAGLFSHIGRLAIAIHQPEIAQKARTQSRNTKTPLFEIEERLLGFNHSQVGGALVGRWGFGEKLVQGIIHYRNPGKCRHPSQEVHILHISEVVANDLKLGNTGELIPPKPNLDSVKALGITRSMLASVKEEVLAKINLVSGLFLP